MNKNTLVKFCILIFLCLLVSGCLTSNIWNPPRVEQLDPMEYFGSEGSILSGRLFSSFCESNAFGNASTARNTAVTNAAKKSKELGYPYFTIIWNNADQTFKMGTYDTIYYHPKQQTVTTHQYNYTFYSYECIFVILEEGEIDGWDNIYSVSKYTN